MDNSIDERGRQLRISDSPYADVKMKLSQSKVLSKNRVVKI
jgi:hypothetical protein